MKGKSKKNKGKKIAEEAQNKIDSPTKLGAKGPFEFDNSGLSYFCCSTAGITIPESLKEQSEGGKLVEKPEAGDLIFFDTIGKGEINYVGVCIGNGKMIHAPGSGKMVKEAEYVNNTYWTPKYKFAKRYWS